ncbi:peptidase S66 [Dyadobacter endophyticus]|uniref:Peptidase S66 n=1 Tax=Dyadobacter endophyticus TaxID=1749036 RepID=A0ABQ1Z1Z2_9BACT|nr:LD-carboxypeptidase [Dyadobacter endophyticus]GGH44954.1 peptidase S66 [Dyadobacter endophyticus]
MNPIQFPAFLKPGDRIGVLAPASIVKYEDVLPGIKLFTEQWGLEVVEGKTLRTSFNQFSASDEDRLTDMQQMLDDPSIKAIIAARGGYGCSRIVDSLNFDTFLQTPKWIVGFSDLTAFLSRTFQLGFASIHAPMAKTITCAGAELAGESLRQMLFGEMPAYEIPAHPLNRSGHATAQVVGGNLCLLAHMIGSDTETDTDGKILFIEDINEYLYNLDRMMIQLKRSGKLAKLAGLVVGQFTDMKDNNSPTFGKDSYQIIEEHVAAFGYPVCYDFPVGHVGDNRAMGVGMEAALCVDGDGVQLRFLSNSAAV